MTDVDLSEEALVRIPVGLTGEGLPAIPAAPAGPDLTASFSSPQVAAEHAQTLEGLGYRVVGVEDATARRAGHASRQRAALHVLVPRHVRQAHPEWWQQLTSLADHAYSLAFGPVRASFREVLRAHLGPPR